jgi:hypothetical protein
LTQKLVTHISYEAIISIGNFKKSSYISIPKPKNFAVFAFTYVSKSPALFYGDFSMNLFSVDTNEAMKGGDEALNTSSFQL